MDCNTLIIESNDAIRNALLAIFQKQYVNYYIKVNTCFNMPTKILKGYWNFLQLVFSKRNLSYQFRKTNESLQ